MRMRFIPGCLLGMAAVAGAHVAPAVAADPPTVEVATPEELSAALTAAEPGQTIKLAPGSYAGEFVASARGTEDAPITLTGPRDAVLANDSGYGLHVENAAHWQFTGFAVSGSTKGIVLDGSNHVVIDGVEVSEVEDEAVHFRSSSSDNVLRNSVIHDTGLKQPQYGEAVYFGSAKSNWSKYGENGGPDRSDRNQALNNTLGPNVRAELVDIKEGTEGGVVRGNTFDGHGISGENYADSWLDLKGNGYTVEGNQGNFDGEGALLDGYQVHTVVDGYGCGNTFKANKSDLGGADGYAINVTNQEDCGSAPNVVTADNTAQGAGQGLTNIEPTRG